MGRSQPTTLEDSIQRIGKQERQVVLALTDGRKETAVLAEPFDPEKNRIDVILKRNGKKHCYDLADVCCVLMIGTPQQFESSDLAEFTEIVETTAGEEYHVRLVENVKHQTGFYGYPTESDTPYKHIFFTLLGVRARRQDRLLGEILEEQGLVTHAAIQEALQEQKELRTRRVGEIIANHNNLSQETIERTLQEAMDKGYVPPRARIGDILIAAGLVTREQVEEALSSQELGKKKKVGALLIDHGLITEEQLLAALATKFRMRMVNLENVVPHPDALRIVPRDLVYQHQIFPIECANKHIVVATSEPTDPTISDTIRFNTSCRVELVVAPAKQIAAAIETYFGKSEDSVVDIIDGMMEDAVTVEDDFDDALLSDSGLNEADSQIIALVNKILIDGYMKGASDIHFEHGMGSQPFKVRYRIDGICHIEHQIPATYKHAIISRIKIIAKLDIAERRRPQSGKILMRYENRKLEYRVETTPTVGGQEDAVLRILSTSKPMPLKDMGFTESSLKDFQSIISKPYGIVLCVGPTGSGKTTTLHSGLGYINTPVRKIWTAEDPVEITQPGLRQVQMHPKIGLTFQSALRSFLRSDPDVIMIGEMRDLETAKTAVEASLTGHLVLSTLHTNSAPETVIRLIEMGIDHFTFGDALLGILAQRLARRLCDQCKKPYHPGKTEYENLVRTYGEKWFSEHHMPDYSDDLTLMQRTGCEHCNGIGFKGRMAIHELLVGTDRMKQTIKKNKTAEQIRTAAIKEGMRTLKMDGIQKVFEGITDLEQVLRVCL
jgi:type II secretory ATPase GspE/PulE/Tfp pilus assembly ATPase PilB-like protein